MRWLLRSRLRVIFAVSLLISVLFFELYIHSLGATNAAKEKLLPELLADGRRSSEAAKVRDEFQWAHPGDASPITVSQQAALNARAADTERIYGLSMENYQWIDLSHRTKTWLDLSIVSMFPFVIMALYQPLQQRREKRTANQNTCLNCQYDLTGNTSGRCPECGRPTDRGFIENRGHLRRRVLPFLAAVLLFLSVAIGSLWVRSDSNEDALVVRLPGYFIVAGTDRGTVALLLTDGTYDREKAFLSFKHDPATYAPVLRVMTHEALGFGWTGEGLPLSRGFGWMLCVPIWFVIALFLLAGWQFITAARPRRNRALPASQSGSPDITPQTAVAGQR